jgi:hypothetical protein
MNIRPANNPRCAQGFCSDKHPTIPCEALVQVTILIIYTHPFLLHIEIPLNYHPPCTTYQSLIESCPINLPFTQLHASRWTSLFCLLA